MVNEPLLTLSVSSCVAAAWSRSVVTMSMYTMTAPELTVLDCSRRLRPRVQRCPSGASLGPAPPGKI